MKKYEHIEDFTSTKQMAVTVGTFDGLHLGHQKIIGRLKEIARKINGETVVVTFSPHPRIVLYADSKNMKFINTRERKFKLLEGFGIDHLVIIPFTKEFAKNTPEDFIRDFLTQKINMKKLVIGYDHHFGSQREGNFERLSELGEKYGYEVEEIPALLINDTAVSSTKIRHALMDGEVKWANEMLGYEYSITGIVVEGNRIGRTIGFPTANIEIEDKYKLIAAGGVYACKIEYKGKIFSGMGNIGTRPTIGLNGLVTEVHIFDFDEEIYGEEIRIIFVDRIRDEVKFAGLEALKNQLSRDRENVKGLLNKS